MRALAALLVVPLLLVAGCVRPLAETPAAETETASLSAALADLDLPCEAEVGKGTSANLAKVAQWRTEEGDLGEADVRGDLALLVRHQLGGLYVLDLADPAQPTLVGTLPLDETMGLDVKWMPKGDAALIADFGAIHVVDMTDPANPVHRNSFLYKDHGLTGQAHMLYAKEIAGKEWVFVATQTTRQPVHVLQRDGWNLSLVTSFAGLPVVHSAPLGNHDLTIYDDELLGGKPVLYLADGLAGWSAWDVSDPAAPKRIGGSLSLEPGAGYTHTVRVAYHEGKRIVVTMSEVGLNTLKVYDATNLDVPVLLGRWNADPARPHIPQHNIQLHHGRLYMGHYTEGVYVFNLTPVMESPPVLGTLALKPEAHYAVEEAEQPSALGFANVWEVVLVDGIIWATDGVGTFTGLAFGCLTPGDEAENASL